VTDQVDPVVVRHAFQVADPVPAQAHRTHLAAGPSERSLLHQSPLLLLVSGYRDGGRGEARTLPFAQAELPSCQEAAGLFRRSGF
jgi:hypothetical protein